MAQTTSSAIETAYRERFPQSARLFERAERLFPDGVTHDSRAMKPFPVMIESSLGSRKQTVDGVELIDYWSGHGALLLGHGHPAIVEAVQKQVALGTHWGASHELEIRWAELVRQLVPSGEMVRFTSSGTEATLMAVRLARIETGRQKVAKFACHFHGWHDQLALGADLPTVHADPGQPGITSAMTDDIVIVPPNDPDRLEQLLREHQPACLILEPTGGHWGQVPIRGEFLHQVREITERHDVLLIFDEVITGFRVHPGGAQAHFGIMPDLTTLAKILAGGLPGGAVAGRADILSHLSSAHPTGKKMKHHGTYNGNPLSAAAGIAALELVATGEPCERATRAATLLREGLNGMFQSRRAPLVAYGDFSMLKINPRYSGEPVDGCSRLPWNGATDELIRPLSPECKSAFRAACLLEGIDWMGFGGLMSIAHSDEDIRQTVESMARAVDRLQEDGWLEC